MKRNLLLLVLMLWVAFGFTVAQAVQDPNDNGIADTLYLEVWRGDDSWYSYPAYVRFPMYITSDIPDPTIDSISGIVIPLCYTSTNAAANATIPAAVNNTCIYPGPTIDNSIFRHMPDNATEEITNFMMHYSEDFSDRPWDTRIIDLAGGTHFWMSIVPTGTGDQSFPGGSRVLTATITFRVDDSTNICLDTCFWPPTGRLALSRADAVTYFPQIWDDYLGTEEICFEIYTLIANMPPQIWPCPDPQSHSENGSYATSAFSVNDPDCPGTSTLASASVTFTGAGVANVAFNPVFAPGGCDYAGEVTYDVTDHCQAGGTILVTVYDSQGDADTCTFDITLTNDPPEVTCPADTSVKYCDGFQGQAIAIDPNGDAITFSGDHTDAAGNILFNTACEDVGQHTINVTATDACGASDQCSFTLTVTNAPPTIIPPDDAVLTSGALHVSTDFEAADDCDDFRIEVSISPSPVNAPVIVGNHVEWQTDIGEQGTYKMYLFVTDKCGTDSEDECDIELMPQVFTNLFIPNSECVNPGEYVCLPILLDNNTTPFGGFEIAVEFDYTSMTFVGAEPGPAMEGFEKFVYRLLPCPLCGCCKYKILLYGQYDMPDGTQNIGDPIPITPLGVYETLVDLCFVVNNDENLRGLKIPVCFEWEGTIDPETGCLVEDWNCPENTFSSLTGDTLYTSMLCCQFVADICDDPSDRVDGKLIFQWGLCGQNCGGVDVCAAGPGACKRGDINMNTITYEVADAVLFASYFVEGTSVFRYDMAYQICATDVNADGRTLTLSDLVYLIRVILHDAVEIPKVTPSSEVANVIVYNGTISTECAAPIGAILFEFDSAVNPTLLADMEMVHKGNKVLVWSSAGNSFTSAEVLTADAELVSVSAVDRDSRELNTTITAKVAPTAFALHPAYPNPFNPFVNLSFNLPEAMDYSLRIYNVAGQLVRSYSGVGSQSLNVVTWDGRDEAGNEVSSGVYFYKLTAAGFSATEKMIMMK